MHTAYFLFYLNAWICFSIGKIWNNLKWFCKRQPFWQMTFQPFVVRTTARDMKLNQSRCFCLNQLLSWTLTFNAGENLKINLVPFFCWAYGSDSREQIKSEEFSRKSSQNNALILQDFRLKTVQYIHIHFLSDLSYTYTHMY